MQPTYLSGHYGYLLCSDAINPLQQRVDWAAFQGKQVHTKYYSPQVQSCV